MKDKKSKKDQPLKVNTDFESLVKMSVDYKPKKKSKKKKVKDKK